jgi:SAM-dependent methyltransferase
MGLAQKLDDALHRSFGLPYLRLARERSIHERCRYGLAAFERLGLERPQLLDVGCGSGLMLRYFARYRHGAAGYTGIDRAASRLEGRYARVAVPHRFLDLDLDSDWRVPGNDMAWCSEVLEHLYDDRAVLRRIAASVKPGGAIVVTMPSLPFLERVALRIPQMLEVSPAQDGGHVRAGYSPETLRALAADCGLDVLRIDAVSPRYDFEIRSRYGAPRGLLELIDRIPFSRAPKHVFDAGAATLERYFSIAAVLKVP